MLDSMSGVSIHCHQFPLNLETNVQIHLQQKVTSYIKTRIIYIHSEKNRHFRFVLDMKKSSFFGWLKIPGVPVASRSPSNSTNLDPGWPQVKSGDSKCMETSKCLWCLGGGNSKYCLFLPQTLGKRSNLTTFQMGGRKPPTSWFCWDLAVDFWFWATPITTWWRFVYMWNTGVKDMVLRVGLYMQSLTWKACVCLAVLLPKFV